MKSGFLIVAFVVVLSGCMETRREGTATRNSGVLPVVVSNNATNDSPATNSSRADEGQDIIKAGDTLLITFTNSPQSGLVGGRPFWLESEAIPAFDQRVKDDGTINLIYNRVFKAAGKKTGDLEKEIRDYYVPTYFRNLNVTVLLLSGSFIYVDGEFRNPGRYGWTNGMRLKDAIDAAGGFTEFSNHRVKVIHSDGTTERFIRLRGDWSRTNNPALNPGDRIHNPRTVG